MMDKCCEQIVSSSDSGVKLITLLSAHLKGRYSARQLKQAIELNRCRINGRTERFASYILGVGDRVSIDLEGFESKGSSSWAIEKERILFEDAHLLAYDKPAGVNCDAAEVREHFGLELLHRLDRETTGGVLLAKNPQAAEAMLLQFKQHQVGKTYVAIVDGHVSGNAGIIENTLGKKKIYHGQTLWGEVERSQGLYAYTAWRCIQAGKDASLLHCYPKTGRTHQLRVHLSGMGHPVLGDFQYGNRFRSKYRPSRHLLHALEVKFIHPATGQQMHICAPLPKDFALAKKTLGLS